MSKFSDAFCPHCSENAVAVYFDPYILQCENCGSRWKSRMRYDMECNDKADLNTDYITSGDLQYDLEKLIEVATKDAVEEAVNKAMTEFTDSLEKEAREIFAGGSASRDYELYDLVVGRAQTVRRRIRRAE